MSDTTTVIVEELLKLFKGDVEAIGVAVICDGDYKDESREIVECLIARSKS